jgi:hypothetical protein
MTHTLKYGGRMLLAVVLLFVLTGNSFAQSAILSNTELKSLVTNAKTKQDHEKLAAHFDAKAMQFETEAKEHRELAAAYRAAPSGHEQKHPMSGKTAAHCEHFATQMSAAAMDARSLAADHREMAKSIK